VVWPRVAAVLATLVAAVLDNITVAGSYVPILLGVLGLMTLSLGLCVYAMGRRPRAGVFIVCGPVVVADFFFGVDALIRLRSG
jgi:hypothetical protein